VPAPTNTERIEANKDAIQSIERTVAVHNQRFETLNREVDKLTEEFEGAKELLVRIDERQKRVDITLDRVWKLLIGVAIATLIGQAVFRTATSGN